MPGARAVDYAEVLYDLLYPVGEYRPRDAVQPIASRVAERLGVSRASAGEMLKRMDEQGLVLRGPGRSLRLTKAGVALAEQGVRATRVLEVFLLDELGFGPDEVHERALAMREAFDLEVIERLHAKVGAPETCPHGWPIGVGRTPSGDLQRLGDLDEGERCKIVGVSETDAALVRWLWGAGLKPGAALRVVEVASAVGHVRVDVRRGGEVVVADRAARGVYVTS